MSKLGELTAEIGRGLQFEKYDVFYDHDAPGERVGRIVSTLEEKFLRRDELSQLDIAIVEKESDKAIALIRIEERNDKPKSLLGDAFGVLLGEYIFFQRKRRFTVNKRTTLIVFGKSRDMDDTRNKQLRKRINKLKSKLSTGNARIGKVVIKSFVDEKELPTLLLTEISKAFKE